MRTAAAAEPAGEAVGADRAGDVPPDDAAAAWAARFLQHSEKRRRVDGDVDGGISSDSDASVIGEALTDEVLGRTFKDLLDSDRCDRIAGRRLAEHFAVKVRGCERNKRVAGDRLDYARGGFVGQDVGYWCEVHLPTKTKDFNLKNCGEINAGKLAAEWWRRCQWLYDLWCTHGSWEAAGGVAAFDTYRETEEFAEWLDALPPGEARKQGMELRKLRPHL